MIVMLEIPKEYENDYTTDRFANFFGRVCADIDNKGMCGRYEEEIAIMMRRAFGESRHVV